MQEALPQWTTLSSVAAAELPQCQAVMKGWPSTPVVIDWASALEKGAVVVDVAHCASWHFVNEEPLLELAASQPLPLMAGLWATAGRPSGPIVTAVLPVAVLALSAPMLTTVGVRQLADSQSASRFAPEPPATRVT